MTRYFLSFDEFLVTINIMMKSRKYLPLRFLGTAVLVCFILPIILVKNSDSTSRLDVSNIRNGHRFTRDLESRNHSTFSADSQPKTNCVEPSIKEFPGDFMTQHMRREGGVVVHVLIALYLFGALAVACDDYFVASLERICEDLKLKKDVAGATFMAAGSSAPEFFTSVIGVFITNGDIGLGTIVGSAVFNILFIVAICGMCAGCVLKLGWWPLMRDCVYYMLSIAALVVVTYDKEVYWYEALVLVIMYLIYVLIMYFNTGLENFFKRLLNQQENVAITDNDEENKSLIDNDSFRGSSQDVGDEERMDTEVDVVSFNNQDNETPLTIPTGFFSVLLWVTFLPISVLFFISIPNCRKNRWKNWYFVTFVISVIWIAGLSYLLVWMVEIIGYTLGIPDVIMGLTFLAAGSSVPDGISSLLVARQGEADMAVSNTVGSNIFDILLCLGVPWLIKTTAVKLNSTVNVLSGSIIYTSASLFGTVVVTVLLFSVNRWRLNKLLGVIFLVLYLAFISVATLFELNVFGDYNLPVCKV